MTTATGVAPAHAEAIRIIVHRHPLWHQGAVVPVVAGAPPSYEVLTPDDAAQLVAKGHAEWLSGQSAEAVAQERAVEEARRADAEAAARREAQQTNERHQAELAAERARHQELDEAFARYSTDDQEILLRRHPDNDAARRRAMMNQFSRMSEEDKAAVLRSVRPRRR